MKVERLNSTAMNVSFTRLSIVEARSVSVTYTVRYSPQTSRKRQERAVPVPDGQSHVVIGGIDSGNAYGVVVVASNSIGMMPSEELILPGKPTTYERAIISFSWLAVVLLLMSSPHWELWW